jgi:glyoxylase-like metal-dependent hydrolase (beta-lactamase superfamily II)
LVVGPGTSAAKLPPWPENPQSTLTESDVKGRTLIEIGHSEFIAEIGGFPAYDFFGDQSFYLLDAPGHAIGHMCGLARTTENSFIMMGADTCHHAGQFRPSQYLPMLKHINHHPYNPVLDQKCPCIVFESSHPHPDVLRTEAFYGIRVNEDGTTVAYDVEKAKDSIRNLQVFDAAENVFVVCAHDTSLISVVDFFPKDANEWKDANWKWKSLWKFLGDWETVAALE